MVMRKSSRMFVGMCMSGGLLCFPLTGSLADPFDNIVRFEGDVVTPDKIITEPDSEIVTIDKIAEQEFEFWTTVLKADDVDNYRIFIARYPDGNFAAIAAEKLNAIHAKAARVEQQHVARLSLKACDAAAAEPHNGDNPEDIAGVSKKAISISSAFAFCEDAVKQNPDSHRAAYQFARVLDADKQYDLAFSRYEPLAEAGYASAQVGIGYLYISGRGVDAIQRVALDWFRAAALQKNASGEFALGAMHARGLGGLEKNYKTAAQFYQLAADKNHASALNNLGTLYARGRGVEKDLDLAFSHYNKAAELEHVSARVNLGFMYYKGRTVDKDYKKAAGLFKQGAASGNRVAQYQLGTMYRSGKGFTQSYSKARKWFQKSADNKYSRAAYELGNMYAKGDGVQFNPDKAAEFYFRSLQLKKGYVIRIKNWDLDTAIALQTQMKHRGYFTGELNGEMGSATQKAMRALCKCKD